MLRPKPFFPGARVALVAPASAAAENALPPALALVRRLGLEPVVFPSCEPAHREGYLAAPDTVRAEDIHRAFADPGIDGVWCVRGGYGGHRILPLLDPAVIREHPKWFGGYSDVTALHIYFNQVCGLETYHCVMPATEPDPNPYTRRWLEKALFGGLEGALENPPEDPWQILAPGRAEGPLCGGNLSLVVASLGTPWEIDTRGKLLFLEDIGEKTYRIDAMLTQLRNAGKLHEGAGILLGAWTNCAPEDPGRALTLEQIFRQLILPAGKPVMAGIACGHCPTTLALPMGRRCALDADRGTLALAGKEGSL